MKFVFILLLFSLTDAINQTCSLIQLCPVNADCSPLYNYCVCDPGFIGKCDQRADPLAQYPYLIQLNPYTIQLFYVKPIQTNQFIQIVISMCRQKDRENVPIVLSVWTETGQNTQYLPTNTLYHPVQVSFESICRTYTIKFANFGVQTNGESEMLIVGLSGNKHKTILSLTAQQKLMQGVNFYYYIMIGLIVFVVVLSIVSGATMWMRRRRWLAFFRSRGYIVQNSVNLDHFQIFMPSVQAKKQIQKQVCPICLQNIEAKQQIRKTPCSHTFHTPCLDSWCITNLNCPVCRSDFSVEKIAEIGSQPQRKQEKALPQQAIQVELQNKRERENIREQMLQ